MLFEKTLMPDFFFHSFEEVTADFLKTNGFTAVVSDIDNTLAAAQPRQTLKMKATRDYPIGLPLAVKELCESHKEVYRVWILAARGEQDNEDHKLLVVDFDGKGEDLFPHLAKAVRLYLRQGERLEMRKADIHLLRVAEQAARPIYEKA